MSGDRRPAAPPSSINVGNALYFLTEPPDIMTKCVQVRLEVLTSYLNILSNGQNFKSFNHLIKMKICGLVLSSHYNSCDNGHTGEHKNSQHKFTTKKITKETTDEELDEICGKVGSFEYDYFWVFPEKEIGVRSLEVIKYLQYIESKQVPLLGPTSKFLSMTMGPIENYEKLIKNSENGIQIETKEKNEFVSDGVEVTVTVVETFKELMALSPVEMSEKNGTHLPPLFEENNEIIKRAAIEIYEAMGVTGSGYAKFHFYLAPNKTIYLRKVAPLLFSLTGEPNVGDNEMIQSIFPGGHTEFIETVILAKQRTNIILSHYDKVSTAYDSNIQTIAQYTPIFRKLVSMYNFEGTILDLGCGTGHLGNIVHEKYPSAVLTGVDISEKMAQFAKGYAKIKIGKVEDVILEETSYYDHVVACGLFPFVDTSNFLKVLSLMFCLGKSSVSLTIEDYVEDYNDKHWDQGNGMFVFNHRKTMEVFEVPQGWSLKFKERMHAWSTSEHGSRLDAYLYHFERSDN